MAEKRRAARTRVRLPGQVVLGDNGDPIPCIIPDLSRGGARLRFKESVALPSRFALLLGGTAERCEVEVRWHQQREFGVQFVGGVPAICLALMAKALSS